MNRIPEFLTGFVRILRTCFHGVWARAKVNKEVGCPISNVAETQCYCRDRDKRIVRLARRTNAPPGSPTCTCCYLLIHMNDPMLARFLSSNTGPAQTDSVAPAVDRVRESWRNLLFALRFRRWHGPRLAHDHVHLVPKHTWLKSPHRPFETPG